MPSQTDESLSLGLEDIFDTKFWKEDMGEFDSVLDQLQQEPLNQNQNFRNRPREQSIQTYSPSTNQDGQHIPQGSPSQQCSG